MRSSERPALAVERRKSSSTEFTVADQYELLIHKLALAERELEQGGTGRDERPLEDASRIVFGLLYGLDFTGGDELVPRLAAVYGYIGNELLNIRRTNDHIQFQHLRDMIAALRPQ